MESGGLFVMVTVVLVKLKLMWFVTSWALLQPRDMELWTLWGKCMCYNNKSLQCCDWLYYLIHACSMMTLVAYPWPIAIPSPNINGYDKIATVCNFLGPVPMLHSEKWSGGRGDGGRSYSTIMMLW